MQYLINKKSFIGYPIGGLSGYRVVGVSGYRVSGYRLSGIGYQISVALASSLTLALTIFL